MEKEFWENRWQSNEIQWDIGHASPAILTYFETLPNSEVKILIPGCGNAYEAEEIYNLGFKNVFIIDLSESAIRSFRKRCPNFPENQIICGDFFNSKDLENHGPFDIVIEQTFFCAINPSMRTNYCIRMSDLLKSSGALIGLLFNVEKADGPPFGGSKDEYLKLFIKRFKNVLVRPCLNSIKPRENREFWIEIKEPIQ